MASKAKKKVAKRKKKMAESAPVLIKFGAKCPMCLTEYSDRTVTEPVYECTACSLKGFDCCVAGMGVMCSSCEENEQEYEKYYDGWYEEEDEEGMID